MRFSLTLTCLIPVAVLLASCATQQSTRTVPASGIAATAGKGETKARVKSAETSDRKTEAPASGKEAKDGKDGRDAKAPVPSEAPQAADLSAEDIRLLAENQVLCARYIGPSALEDAMRKASLIQARGATTNKTTGATTYRILKPFRFLGLPVASVSFANNGDPDKAAFWMTLDVPMKSAMTAVTARGIPLKKDIRLGYVLASNPKRGQRVELHSQPKQTMVLCARVPD